MPVGAAIGVTGLAGAAANVYAGSQQQKASEKASKVQKDMYAQQRADFAPYLAAGTESTNKLMSALPELTSQIKLDQAFLENTPGYRFARQQGLKATQSGAAARGLGNSGAALKAAANYATGLADQTYGTQFDRALADREARFNKLMGASQLGAGAATQTGQGATNTGTQVANNLIGGAGAMGAGLVGGANALSTGAGQYLGYDLGRREIANKLFSGGGGASSYYGSSAPPTRYGFGWPV